MESKKVVAVPTAVTVLIIFYGIDYDMAVISSYFFKYLVKKERICF